MNHSLDERVSNFALQAQAYCDAIDSMGDSPLGEWLARVNVSLADVYHAGLLLPDIASATDAVANTERHSPRLFERLRDYLGEHDAYSMVWDPLDLEDDPITTHLSYDLSDVYRDLKEGLDLIESGMAPAEVIWNWRESFRMHWGQHAVDAMKVIHSLRYSWWL